MKLSKGSKNLIFGIVTQIITIGLGIVIPRLVLTNLGSESNGLMNSVSNALAYLSLLEAGVGNATLYALYKPFADCDTNSINRIMSATNKYYKKTGIIYFIVVVILSLGYGFLIKTDINRLSVFLVTFLGGTSGALNYFFQGKYKVLLQAEGKGYIIINITTIITVCVSISKIILLSNGFDVVALQTMYFLFNFVQMIVICAYIRKNYKWLDIHSEPDYKAISQKNSVLVHQICELIFNNTDVLLLTFFAGLKPVSVYTMYAMIYGMVKSVSVSVSDSYLYALGQVYNTDKKKFLKLHGIYEVYNMAFTFSLFCITMILIIPFLKLYTSGVNDINYIDKYLPILFTTFYLLANARKSSWIIINFAQHFKQTQWRSILESAINIVFSVAFTIKFGIYGVLIGTIAALLYRTNDMIIYSSKLLKRSALITYRRWFRNLALFVLVILFSSKITINLSSYYNLVIYGIALSVVVIPLFIAVNSAFEPEIAKYVFSHLFEKIKSKPNR